MLRDPLIHFLAIGALLFALFVWRGSDEPAPETIRIGPVLIEQAVRSATLLEGRDLSAAELEAIVAPIVRDEIYYREALALGLDVDDDEVRRRLIEKLQYLTENLADPAPPDEAELRNFYRDNPARFEQPAAATFDQIFFSPAQRGDGIADDIDAALTALAAGAPAAEYGDPTPLESRLTAAASERVRILFGEAMAQAVFSAPLDIWQGPFRSDFGLHLFRVIDRTSARVPAFDEIPDTVEAVYTQLRREQTNEAAFAEIRDRYDVVIDWPDSLAADAESVSVP